MARLVLSLDGRVLAEFQLDKPRLTVGRRIENDIQIDNLAVSGQHAVITTVGNDSVIEDMGSTNGTMINGNLATRHILQDGDVIDIGKHRLKYFREVQAGHAAQADFEKTMVIRPATKTVPPPSSDFPDTVAGAIKPAPSPQATQPIPAQSAAAPESAAPARPPVQEAPAAAIQVLTGPNAGKSLDLTKSVTTLGKPKVQVAVITKRPQGYFITHVEGSFPAVNGQVIDAQPRQLKDHDLIELAGTKLEFFLK